MAKIYADLDARSFQNDDIYQQGRYISDKRARKAFETRSGFGKQVRLALWVTREYQLLWELWGAGLPVPKPALGPEPSHYGAAGNVVLMEYLGDREAPAPRLSELRMTPSEAEEAWRQSFEILRHFARLGKVHGDYSTYNLLWYREQVVAIDFPQMVEAHESPRALELLRRDLESLCRSFRRLGVRRDPSDLWRGWWASCRASPPHYPVRLKVSDSEEGFLAKLREPLGLG